LAQIVTIVQKNILKEKEQTLKSFALAASCQKSFSIFVDQALLLCHSSCTSIIHGISNQITLSKIVQQQLSMSYYQKKGPGKLDSIDML
jgi:hypothetical protein